MEKILFWFYIANGILLIIHEMDSAYWKEWKLFKLPGGIGLFLLLHFPIMFFILYGVKEISGPSLLGLIISLIMACGGLFAFIIHNYFIKKGRKEFTTMASQLVLYATLLSSLGQLIFTLLCFKY